MNTVQRVVIAVAVGGAIAGVLVLKTGKSEAGPPTSHDTSAVALPRLVDLGSGACQPCKMMAPILDELKDEYAGTFDVEFIDVRQKPEAAKPYGIRLIPTQIFYDQAGQELFRHEGFFGKKDILATWREHGILAATAETE
jgi:thioredoxin 1